jgi:hypothetical protein
MLNILTYPHVPAPPPAPLILWFSKFGEFLEKKHDNFFSILYFQISKFGILAIATNVKNFPLKTHPCYGVLKKKLNFTFKKKLMHYF